MRRNSARPGENRRRCSSTAEQAVIQCRLLETCCRTLTRSWQKILRRCTARSPTSMSSRECWRATPIELDEIVDGLIRLTGGSTKQQQLAVYDLDVPRFGPDIKVPHGQLVIPEPTAVVALDTQRLLLRPGDGALVPVEGSAVERHAPEARSIQNYPEFRKCELSRGRPSLRCIHRKLSAAARHSHVSGIFVRRRSGGS